MTPKMGNFLKMTAKSKFDASASMLGYLYQVRYGLYLSLKKLLDVDEPEQFNVSIEKLDDIGFDEEGTATELLQTKFHCEPGNLTNRSPDIWKTIRVWVESIRNGDIELGRVSFTLVTTQTLPDDTVAYYLGIGQGRNTSKAIEIMTDISVEDNAINAKGYVAFQSLNGVERQAFVDSIYVVGKSDDLLQIRTKINRYGRQSVSSEKVEAFVDRLEGVWFKWCVDQLSQNPSGIINLGAVQDLIDKLRPEYTQTNLPTEFADELPDVIDLDSDLRIFVQQLRLFNAPKIMIEQAVIYYYRAFEQRTKWSTDGLLNPGELGKYDRKLQEQWKDQQAYLEAIEDIEKEQGKRKFSVELYHHCLQNGVVPIRCDFTEAYVSKGSYQILADQLKIGWHPDYLTSLGDSSNEGVA
jgi:C-terminal domain 7 of the ABC-three component (ABC-3C) systems